MKPTATIHPRFEKYSKFTYDEFWTGVFLNMAHGNFPRGVYYDQSVETLTFQRKKNTSIGLGQENSTEDIFNNFLKIRNFLRNSGISSPQEKKISTPTTTEPQVFRHWKKIKPKDTKKHMIFQYTRELVAKLGGDLSEEDKKLAATLLAAKINVAILHKSIKSSDVVLKNSKIKKIRGLIFQDGEILFPPTKAPRKKKETKASTKTKKNQLEMCIKRMLRENRTRIVKLS